MCCFDNIWLYVGHQVGFKIRKYLCLFSCKKNQVFLLLFFSGWIQTPQSDCPYARIHRGREMTTSELVFFCFAVKPLNGRFFFQNCCTFLCVSINTNVLFSNFLLTRDQCGISTHLEMWSGSLDSGFFKMIQPFKWEII